MRNRQIILGIMTWLGLAIIVCAAVRIPFAQKPQELTGVLSGIARWVSGAPGEHEATSTVKLLVAPGDPVFIRLSDGGFRQVGHVRNHFAASINPAATDRASIVLYDDAVATNFPNGFLLEYHATPTALDWVVRTMVTPERQKEIASIIAKDWKQHREEIMTRLQPIIEKSLATTVSAIEAELPGVMNAHRSDFALLADRYQSEVIRSQIVPLVREQILPIVEDEVRPIAMELGKDLWDRVSLWSFTWRYLYDVSPLPEKNAVQLEFARFIKDEVTPALESRSDDFVAVTERILRRISRNEKVRSVVRENLRKVATDAELQKIVWKIVQESVINNQTLRTSLRQYWESPEVRDTLIIASTQFEPTARTIGNSIFGTRETGVTPEFARVLRAQILLKDRRWLVVAAMPPQTLPTPLHEKNHLIMIPGPGSMTYPLEFKGSGQSPLTIMKDDHAARAESP